MKLFLWENLSFEFLNLGILGRSYGYVNLVGQGGALRDSGQGLRGAALGRRATLLESGHIGWSYCRFLWLVTNKSLWCPLQRLG